MKIAYLIGSGVDLHSQNSPLIRIKAIVDGLRKSTDQVTLVALDNRQVIISNEWDFNNHVKLRITGSWLFNKFESGVRRLQGIIHLPYFGLFDSLRFYEACRGNLSQFDILHERCGLLRWGGILASKKLKLPLVLDVEADFIKEYNYVGAPLLGMQRSFASFIFHHTLEAANVITVVSDVLKDELVTNWGVEQNKIVVFPNGVDTEVFNPTRYSEINKQNFALNEEVIVTFVGYFYQWHDVDTLIEAFHLALNEIPEIRLLLIGDGDTMPQILNKINKYNLIESIILTGNIEHKIIPDYLKISDICIAPYPKNISAIWFSPLKLLEYMAAGKAIIASRTGQVAEVIQHDITGVLVDQGDVQELAKAIINLIKDPGKREKLGKNARKKAIEIHSWIRYVSNLKDLYTNVAENFSGN